MKSHLSRQLVQAVKKKEALQGMEIISEIEGLITRTKNILDEAESKKKYETALHAIGEARQGYQLLCQIAVALHETRKDELEAEQKQKDQARTEEDRELINEALSRLNPVELAIYKMLNIKMIADDQKMIVFPERGSDDELLKAIKNILPYDFEYDTPKVLHRTRPPSRQRNDNIQEDIIDTPEDDHPVQPLEMDQTMETTTPSKEQYPDWYIPGKKYEWINGRPVKPSSGGPFPGMIKGPVTTHIFKEPEK